jgi:hypothetical protein
MPRRNLPHIIVSSRKDVKPYQSTGQTIRRNKPGIRNRLAHVDNLINRFDALSRAALIDRERREAQSLPSKDGFYIRVRSFPGFKLTYSKLELKSENIRVLHHNEPSGDDETEDVILYIPFTGVRRFLQRLESYKNDVINRLDRASQSDLVEFISSIEEVVFEQFWQEPNDLRPGENSIWMEAWVWTDDLTTIDQREIRLADLRNTLRSLRIEYKESSIHFTERTVVLVYGNEGQMNELLRSTDFISEFRVAKSTVQFIVDLDPLDQSEICQNLLDRVEILDQAGDISVSILDHGVNREHPLIEPHLNPNDRHTINIDWGYGDDNGHGTEMAGLAIYGSLSSALESQDTIQIGHIIESSKILPPRGSNPKELYGNYTKQAVSLLEVQSPERKRIINMSVTADDEIDRGRPSSWSAAVDEICFSGNNLFMVSAGNCSLPELWAEYPQGNLLSPVQDPGQAWNAVTVGAFTQLSNLTDPTFQNHETVAQNGQLSPYSSTGFEFDSQWPVKPEILFEGGNVLKAPDGFLSAGMDELSVITTSHDIANRLLTTTWATSSATALASEFTARLQRAYPTFWGETIRGLTIHSAEWSQGMRDQFEMLGIDLTRKSGYQKALKVFGYGVPSFEKARHSADNSLTLIAESNIQPFIKRVGERLTFNELHIYELPWPKEMLLELGETEVELKITLSYFIEPMPGSRGNKDKYRYASHQLEFQISEPGDDIESFSLRMGEKLEGQEYSEARSRISHREDRWIYGVNSRNSGSIHSDKMKMTGAELSDCNLIAVYPKTGWWYTRNSQKKFNSESRYSLIITISTPDEEIDFYTPVEAQVAIPINIEV